MRRVLFDIHGERRNSPAESLRPDAQSVYASERPALKLRVKPFGVFLPTRRSTRASLKRRGLDCAAEPHADDYGRTRFEPAFDTHSVIKSSMSSAAAVGLNMRIALMFSLPNPLGETVILSLSPGTIRVYHGGRVVAGVLANKRVPYD